MSAKADSNESQAVPNTMDLLDAHGLAICSAQPVPVVAALISMLLSCGRRGWQGSATAAREPVNNYAPVV